MIDTIKTFFKTLLIIVLVSFVLAGTDSTVDAMSTAARWISSSADRVSTATDTVANEVEARQ